MPVMLGRARDRGEDNRAFNSTAPVDINKTSAIRAACTALIFHHDASCHDDVLDRLPRIVAISNDSSQDEDCRLF